MTEKTEIGEPPLTTLLERLRADGGRYLLSVGLTSEERNAEPPPTYGSKGHQRWLTEQEHAALCALVEQRDRMVKLLLAVEADTYEIFCHDVDGENWFDARSAVLASSGERGK